MNSNFCKTSKYNLISFLDLPSSAKLTVLLLKFCFTQSFSSLELCKLESSSIVPLISLVSSSACVLVSELPWLKLEPIKLLVTCLKLERLHPVLLVNTTAVVAISTNLLVVFSITILLCST